MEFNFIQVDYLHELKCMMLTHHIYLIYYSMNQEYYYLDYLHLHFNYL